MKIVYCLYQCNQISGGVRIIFEQANRLIARGHEVEIWTIEPFLGPPPFEIKAQIKHIPNEYNAEQQRVMSLFPAKADVIDPDVFIAGSHATIFGNSSLPRAKAFWYLQHDESLTFSDHNEILLSFQQALKLPVRFLCNSAWVAKQLKTKFQVDVELLPCAIDRNLFYPTKPILQTVNIPRLIYVYDEVVWKGMEDFFSGLNILSQTGLDFELILTTKAIPQKIFTQRPVTMFVRPLQNQLAAIYSSSTVFVSSSWYEGFGLPGLEAMACGVPVVTTDSGGVREYAIPEETAIVVPPKNPQALAEGILRVLKDLSLRRKLIENGLNKAKEFGWEKSIDKLERLFTNAII